MMCNLNCDFKNINTKVVDYNNITDIGVTTHKDEMIKLGEIPKVGDYIRFNGGEDYHYVNRGECIVTKIEVHKCMVGDRIVFYCEKAFCHPDKQQHWWSYVYEFLISANYRYVII